MNKKKLIIIILSAIVFLSSLAYIIFYLTGISNSEHNIKKYHKDVSSRELAENPIDFESLKKINEEVYAWIRVPNTNIDYPVAQSAEDDGYYLHHDIYGKKIFSGTIYTEKANHKDFSDRNTVLYGHNMTKGYMFQNLYKFQDEDFFNENTEFYIYTPGHILTYKVFAAYQYDDRHILNSFDFSTNDGFGKYLEIIKDPPFMLKNTRKDMDITVNDKIITLSTCLGNGKKYRYLVQGVLSSDVITK